jgi:DNA-directed RNA polymerase specialized sigma24 family protein
VEPPAKDKYLDTETEQSDTTRLLAAMARGDRAAAAEFVQRYGPLIRRRVRGKMRAAMRRLFDSQDIISTLGRRLDVYIHSGRFNANSERELWALVLRIAENSVVEKARVFASLQAKEGADSPFAAAVLGRLHAADRHAAGGSEVELDRLLESLPNPIDRQIATLWALGHTHRQIAEELGLSEEQTRQRWARARAAMRSTLEAA